MALFSFSPVGEVLSIAGYVAQVADCALKARRSFAPQPFAQGALCINNGN
jgi:hypothetical protein